MRAGPDWGQGGGQGRWHLLWLCVAAPLGGCCALGPSTRVACTCCVVYLLTQLTRLLRSPPLRLRYDELKRQLRDAELQAEAENDEIEYRQKAASAMAALGRGAVSVAGAAPAAAAAVAAATALGGELEVAAAVGAAAAAAGAAAANAVAGGADDALATTSDFEEEEGPAAKAVRQIEEQLSAAEDETYVGDVEEAEGEAEGAAQQPAAQPELQKRRGNEGAQL